MPLFLVTAVTTHESGIQHGRRRTYTQEQALLLIATDASDAESRVRTRYSDTEYVKDVIQDPTPDQIVAAMPDAALYHLAIRTVPGRDRLVGRVKKAAT